MSSLNDTGWLMPFMFMIISVSYNVLQAIAYTQQEVTKLQSIPSGPGRYLLDANNISKNNKSLDDTMRVDPLDHLRKYRGGYNISNTHYWSSTIFTGRYGYGIGAAWAFGGLCIGVFLLIRSVWHHKERRKLVKTPHSSSFCYFRHVIYGVVITVMAIVASAVVLGGSSRLYSRSRTVKSVVLQTADQASDSIHNVTEAMRAIQASGVPLLLGGQGSFDDLIGLNSTSYKLDEEASDIQRQAHKNSQRIRRGLMIIYLITMVIISLNLIAILSLLVSGFFRMGSTFIMLLIICWFLTALCWTFYGIYFFVEKFACDTCRALEDYQHDPVNSSLSSVLLCDDLISAKPALSEARAGIHELINLVNANLSAQPASIFHHVHFCNPFLGPPDYIYQPKSCSANTVRIADIPQILKMVIPFSTYNRVLAYTKSVQHLLDALPDMQNLVECQVVKEAVKEVLFKHCNPLKRYSKMVWVGMAVLATLLVFLVLIWAIKAYHDMHRYFADGSVKPYLSSSDSSSASTD